MSFDMPLSSNQDVNMLRIMQVHKGLAGFWPRLSELVKIWEMHSAFSFSVMILLMQSQIAENEDVDKAKFLQLVKNRMPSLCHFAVNAE